MWIRSASRHICTGDLVDLDRKLCPVMHALTVNIVAFTWSNDSPVRQRLDAALGTTRLAAAPDSDLAKDGNNLAKVVVEGSNPFARSKTPF